MTSSRWSFLAAALAATVISSGAFAQQERGTVAAHETYILDEYNIDVAGAPDSSRIAAGLSFGTAYTNGWWWTAGPRLSRATSLTACMAPSSSILESRVRRRRSSS